MASHSGSALIGMQRHQTGNSRSSESYLNDDIILLEGLVVEGAVQHILHSSSIPHLQATQSQTYVRVMHRYDS